MTVDQDLYERPAWSPRSFDLRACEYEQKENSYSHNSTIDTWNSSSPLFCSFSSSHFRQASCNPWKVSPLQLLFFRLIYLPYLSTLYFERRSRDRLDAETSNAHAPESELARFFFTISLSQDKLWRPFPFSSPYLFPILITLPSSQLLKLFSKPA